MTLFFIKNQNNLLHAYFKGQFRYFLYIKELFIICKLVYSALMQMRSIAFSFVCVFFFMLLRSLKYASLFFSKNENEVNLAVASTIYIYIYIYIIIYIYIYIYRGYFLAREREILALL